MTSRVCILGLGVIDLPTALHISNFYDVEGYDIYPIAVEKANNMGINSTYEKLPYADVYVMPVSISICEDDTPDMSNIYDVCNKISKINRESLTCARYMEHRACGDGVLAWKYGVDASEWDMKLEWWIAFIKGIQYLGMLVGFYLLAQTYVNYRRSNYGIRRTLFFIFLWSIMIVLFLNPSLSIIMLPVLTTQDAIMSVLTLSILTLFLMFTYLNQQISSINKKMTEIVQNIAIEDYISKIKKKENS